MGMPEVIIEFKSKATSVVKRSSRGVVALILEDSLGSFSLKEYKNFTEVKPTDWSEENYAHIKNAFLGTPSKVIAVRLPESGETYLPALKALSSKYWNWLAVPSATNTETDEIKAFISGARKNKNAVCKAVLGDCKANNEGIVNFTAKEILTDESEYSAAEYTPRIAGILAGLPMTRSATFYVLTEVQDIQEVDDPDKAIDSGELILVNDGEKFKIARAVTSFTEVPDSYKKIKIVEGMDIIKKDIRDTFNDQYTGKVLNTYDNKVLFIAATNSYLATLADEGVLDPNHENKIEIDLKAQENYLKSVGVDVELLTEQQIKEYNTDTFLFVSGAVKFADAMEDMRMSLSM